MPSDASEPEFIQAGPGAPRFTLPAAVRALLSAPGSKRGQLQRACLALYWEHKADGTLPTAGRFLWYELEQRGVVDKAQARGHPGIKRGVDQDVNDALLWIREKGLVPWQDIRDDMRGTSNWRGEANLLAGLQRRLDHLALDPWNGAPPIILVESRAVAGTLEPLAREYRVLLSGLGGQVHAHLVTDVVPHLADGTTILYLGDRDLAGDQIEANVLRVLGQHNEATGVTLRRVLLTEEQADEAGLEPILKRDQRYSDGKPHWAVELEAYGQRQIIAEVRAVLDALLPEPLDAVLVQEREERARIRVLLRGPHR